MADTAPLGSQGEKRDAVDIKSSYLTAGKISGGRGRQAIS